MNRKQNTLWFVPLIFGLALLAGNATPEVTQNDIIKAFNQESNQEKVLEQNDLLHIRIDSTQFIQDLRFLLVPTSEKTAPELRITTEWLDHIYFPTLSIQSERGIFNPTDTDFDKQMSLEPDFDDIKSIITMRNDKSSDSVLPIIEEINPVHNQITLLKLEEYPTDIDHEPVFSVDLSVAQNLDNLRNNQNRRPRRDDLDPELVMPYNDAAVGGIARFEWTWPEDAIGFGITISTDEDFEDDDIVFFRNDLEDNFIVLRFNQSAEWWWRVFAFDDRMCGMDTDPWSFRTGMRPDPPLLLLPRNDARLEEVENDFSWRPIPGAAQHRIQFASDGNFRNLIGNSVIGANNTIGVEVPDDGERYYWRVKARNDIDWGDDFSEPFSFIAPEGGEIPDPPDLAQPRDDAEVDGREIEFVWRASDRANNYHIQLSIDDDFAEDHLVYNNDELGDRTEIGLAGFPDDGTEFWWRVRAGNARGWGQWSDEWSFTNGELPPVPDPPDLVQPQDDAEVDGDEIEFEWRASDRAATYYIQIAIDNGFDRITGEGEVGNTTETLVGGFPDNGTEFWWRVCAGNARGWGQWSDVWSFTNGELPPVPDPPDLAQPRDGVEVDGREIEFVWRASDRANNYHIQLSIDDDFAEDHLAYNNDELGDRTEIGLEGFPDNGTEFWWRVRAENARGWSQWSDVWSFTNGELPPVPDPPDLVQPQDDAQVDGEEIEFEWRASDRATTYYIQIALDNGFDRIAGEGEVGNTTETLVGGFPDNGTEFWWRVCAGNARGWGQWSDIWSFTNGELPPVPDPPDLAQPHDDAEVDGEEIEFEWRASDRATTYYIQIALDNGFDRIAGEGEVGNTTETTVEGFPDNGTEFWWRVCAGNARGWGQWSDIWSFTNGGIFNIIENGSIAHNLESLIFNWEDELPEAERYELCFQLDDVSTKLRLEDGARNGTLKTITIDDAQCESYRIDAEEDYFEIAGRFSWWVEAWNGRNLLASTDESFFTISRINAPEDPEGQPLIFIHGLGTGSSEGYPNSEWGDFIGDDGFNPDCSWGFSYPNSDEVRTSAAGLSHCIEYIIEQTEQRHYGVPQKLDRYIMWYYFT
jgi:hypothetical protein